MISKRDLQNEIKRYPALIKAAAKMGHYMLAREYQIEMETLVFVLESD